MEHDQSDAGPFPSLKRLLIATSALPAAAMFAMVSFTPEAVAAPITYTIAPTGVTFVGYPSQTLSGSFVFDTSTDLLDSVDLTLTGPGFSPGVYTVPYQIFSSTGFEMGTGSESLIIAFTEPLADGVDTISFLRQNATWGYPNTSEATADPAIPEPSSLLLLSAALGLFGLSRRRVRR